MMKWCIFLLFTFDPYLIFVNNLVLNNTFKRCYQCGPQSTFWFSVSKAFRLTVHHKLAVSKCSRTSTSNPHSLQQNSTLNGATLIFKSTQKKNKNNPTLYFSYNVYYTGFSIQYFYFTYSFCARIFFLFFFPFFEIMKLADDEMHFFWQTEHRSTNVLLLLEFRGKKNI